MCIIIGRKYELHTKERNYTLKLELDRLEFLKAWQTAEKYTAAKTTKDALNGIRITASEDNTVTLEATDLKSSVKCSARGSNVLEPGAAVLSTAIFGTVIRKTNAKTFTLETGPERGTLTAGKSRSRFAVIAADNFPNIPESSGAESICSVMASDLGRIITEGSSAASAPSDFPKYMGTCLLRTAGQYVLIVSTDGKRLARSQTLCTVHKEEDLLLPAAALKELAKGFNNDGKVEVLADGAMVWFRLEREITVKDEEESSNNDGEAKNDEVPVKTVREVSEFSIRRIDANFPKYEKILNNEVKTMIKVSKSSLLPAVEYIAVFAKNSPAQVMAMYIKPEGELRITARAPETGTAEDVINAAVDGDPMSIGFNVNYFLDGLKVVNSEELIIEFSDDEGQTRMLRDEGKDFLYMLMPIRLTAQDLVSDDDSADFITPSEPEESDDEPQEDDESYSSSDYDGEQESEPQEEPHDEEQEHTEEPF